MVPSRRPDDVQPVLVELETRRQQIRDGLMQAGDEHSADTGFTHRAARVIMSSVRSRVSAAILAGGRARRLGGVDKAALLLGGARIIDRQLAILTAVVRRRPDRRERCGALCGLPASRIPDLVPGAGALGGIYTALAARGTTWSWCSPATCRSSPRAARTARRGRRRRALTRWCPRSARGLEPLCAVYRQRCAPALRGRGSIAARCRSRHGWTGCGCARSVPWRSNRTIRLGRLFANVNTPHDHARARGWVEGNEKPPRRSYHG